MCSYADCTQYTLYNLNVPIGESSRCAIWLLQLISASAAQLLTSVLLVVFPCSRSTSGPASLRFTGSALLVCSQEQSYAA